MLLLTGTTVVGVTVDGNEMLPSIDLITATIEVTGATEPELNVRGGAVIVICAVLTAPGLPDGLGVGETLPVGTAVGVGFT